MKFTEHCLKIYHQLSANQKEIVSSTFINCMNSDFLIG